MTAETEKLRALLDGRGVHWMDVERPDVWRTCWKPDPDGRTYCYFDESKVSGYTETQVSELAAEQVVDATLGRGECELIDEGSFTPHHDFHRVVCSECGVLFWQSRGHLPRASYCPNCGRRVKGER